MSIEELKARTRQFALDVIDLCLKLGADDFARLVRSQLLRAGTGVAANYRGACRSRSGREFAARLAIVVEEADEAELWLDFVETRAYGPADEVAALRREAIEVRAIFATARATTLRRTRPRRSV